MWAGLRMWEGCGDEFHVGTLPNDIKMYDYFTAFKHK
jgi:hypothetical protein